MNSHSQMMTYWTAGLFVLVILYLLCFASNAYNVVKVTLVYILPFHHSHVVCYSNESFLLAITRHSTDTTFLEFHLLCSLVCIIGHMFVCLYVIIIIISLYFLIYIVYSSVFKAWAIVIALQKCCNCAVTQPFHLTKKQKS